MKIQSQPTLKNWAKNWPKSPSTAYRLHSQRLNFSWQSLKRFAAWRIPTASQTAFTSKFETQTGGANWILKIGLSQNANGVK
jgi:hypothetical protein